MQSRLLFLLLWTMPQALTAQFHDNFSDGDLRNNPAWSGDTAHFQTLNGHLALQAPAGVSRSQLTTANQVQLEAVFSGWIRLHFNPSSVNYLDYYILSDTDSLHLPLNGLFIRFGHTADEISLYRQQGSVRTKVIDGPDGMLNFNDNSLRFTLSRDSNQLWTLIADTSLSGGNLQVLGRWADSTRYPARYSGLVCYFSATRADKFYFDELTATGLPWQDKEAPVLLFSELVQPRQLRCRFSESLSPATQANQFRRNSQQQTAENLVWESPEQLLVSFGTPFLPDLNHSISLLQLADTLDNHLDTTLVLKWHQPVFGEIVIHELLADPSPPVLLPEAEFVELYNRSDHTLNLNQYRWSDPGTSVALPAYELPAGGYVILCPAVAASQFSNFGSVLGLATWPSINNDADQLYLKTTDGQIIDSLRFEINWMKNTDKQAGGWSLERLDPEQFCVVSENWSASQAAVGGTPGRPNSVEQTVTDIQPPAVAGYQLPVPDSLWLHFTEFVYAHPSNRIQLNRETIPCFPAGSDGSKAWWCVLPDGGLGNKADTLQISGFGDCSGQLLVDTQLIIAWPAWPEPGDIGVDELLFAPKIGNGSFVELRNRSTKILDLKDLIFGNPGEAGPLNEVALSTNIRLFMPDERLVLTRSAEAVRGSFPQHGQSFQELSSWPSMPQAGGELAIYRKDGALLCRWSYHPEDHFQLLQDTKGVSLERINAGEIPVWHSAAIPPGATPGLPNSQQVQQIVTGEAPFSLQKLLFSPNNDGMDDQMGLCWENLPPGGLLNVSVFSVRGNPVRALCQQQLMGSTDCVYWDGLDDNGRRCATGRYLILTESFWLDGSKTKERLLVVLDALDDFNP